MVIEYAKKITATKKQSLELWGARMWNWRKQKQKLIDMNSTQKSFSGPQAWKFPGIKIGN